MCSSDLDTLMDTDGSDVTSAGIALNSAGDMLHVVAYSDTAWGVMDKRV